MRLPEQLIFSLRSLLKRLCLQAGKHSQISSTGMPTNIRSTELDANQECLYKFFGAIENFIHGSPLNVSHITLQVVQMESK